MTPFEFFQLLENIITKVMGVSTVKRLQGKNGTESQRIGRMIFVDVLNKAMPDVFDASIIGHYLNVKRDSVYGIRTNAYDFIKFNPHYQNQYITILSRARYLMTQYYQVQTGKTHADIPKGSFILRDIKTNKIVIKSMSELLADYQPLFYYEDR